MKINHMHIHTHRSLSNDFRKENIKKLILYLVEKTTTWV